MTLALVRQSRSGSRKLYFVSPESRVNRLRRELRLGPSSAGAADFRDRFLFLISPSASPAPRDWEQGSPVQTGQCVRAL